MEPLRNDAVVVLAAIAAIVIIYIYWTLMRIARVRAQANVRIARLQAGLPEDGEPEQFERPEVQDAIDRARHDR